MHAVYVLIIVAVAAMTVSHVQGSPALFNSSNIRLVVSNADDGPNSPPAELTLEWGEALVMDDSEDVVALFWQVGTTVGGAQARRKAQATAEELSAGGATAAVAATVDDTPLPPSSGSESGAPAVLRPGYTYFATVYAHGASGRVSRGASTGVLVDWTAPLWLAQQRAFGGAVVKAGAGPPGSAHPRAQRGNGSIALAWLPAWDADSGVARYEAAVGVVGGALDGVRAWSSEGLPEPRMGALPMEAVLHPLPRTLVDGEMYVVSVRAVNLAGATTTASAAPLLIDASPPYQDLAEGGLSVQDGAAMHDDKDVASASESTVSARWERFIDPHSPVVSVEWTVANSSTAEAAAASGAPAPGWRWLRAGVNGGSAAHVNLADEGLPPLQNGTRYFVLVRATNAAGVRSEPPAVSDGFYVDGSPPMAESSMSVVQKIVVPGMAVPFASPGGACATGGIAVNVSIVDEDSGLQQLEAALGTTPGGTQTPLMDVPLSLAESINGVSRTIRAGASVALLDGVVYYPAVRATNGAGQSSAWWASRHEGVKVDCSAPKWDPGADLRVVPGLIPPEQSTIADVLGQVILSKASPARILGISWSWTPAEDLHSGVSTYHTALGTIDDPEHVLGFSGGLPGNSTSYTLQLSEDSEARAALLSLPDGAELIASVVAVNGVGLPSTTLIASSRLVLDPTPPLGGTAVLVAPTQTASACCSTPPRVDGTAEQPIYWLDTTDPSSVRVHWEGFIDEETGVAAMELAMGTAAFRTDVIPFTPADGTVTANFPGVDVVLQQGGAYAVSVRVANGAGARRRIPASGTIIVDATPPIPGVVVDTLVVDDDDNDVSDVDARAGSTAVAARFQAFSEDTGEVTQYEWAVGFVASGEQLRRFAPVEVAGEGDWPGAVEATGLEILPDGMTAYVTIRATNAAGLCTDSASDGVILDRSPPTLLAEVSLAVDIDEAADQALSVTWTSAVDEHTGIVSYEWKVVGVLDDWVDVGVVTSAALSAADIDDLGQPSLSDASRDGSQLSVQIRARNAVGLVAVAQSPEVLLDTSPPSTGLVKDGTPTPTVACTEDPQSCTEDDTVEVDYTYVTDRLDAHWTAFVDPHSVVVQYQWAMSTSEDPTAPHDIAEWTDNGGARFASVTALSLEEGPTVYYTHVRAVNAAGLVSEVSTSDGIMIDRTPPDALNWVRDGRSPPGVDVDWHTDRESFSVCWDGAQDGGSAPSGVDFVEVAVGTTPGGLQEAPYRRVSASDMEDGCTTIEGLWLRSGVLLYATVVVLDNVGLHSQMSSDGAQTDLIAPARGMVYSPPENDGRARIGWSDTSSVSVAWTGFVDGAGESGTVGFEVGVASIATAALVASPDIVPFTAVDVPGLVDGAGDGVDAVATATIDSLSLPDGTSAYVIVRATDGVGWTTSVSSNALVIDLTAPIAGTVSEGTDPREDMACLVYTDNIGMSWDGFSDPGGTGIADYRVAIGTTVGGEDILAPLSVGIVYEYTATGLTGLFVGDVIFVTVTAVDHVGLTASATSDGARIVCDDGCQGADATYLCLPNTVIDL